MAQRTQNEEVGRRLKEIRTRTVNPATGEYYTQVELATKFACTQSTIKNYENSIHETPHEYLLKYAELGKTTVDWILTGKQTESEIVGDRIAEARHFWIQELPPVVTALTERIEKQAHMLRRLGTELPRLVGERELRKREAASSDYAKAQASLATPHERARLEKLTGKLLRPTEKGTSLPRAARQGKARKG